MTSLRKILDQILGAMLNADNKHKALWVPLVMSVLTFVGNTLTAIGDDGMISDAEFHTISQSASALSVAVLVVLMALFRSRR